MKIFISHSWKNKMEAQRITDDLRKAGCEVWLDAGNLLPGEPVQETIDRVLSDMDVIVLIWTKEASESRGVAAEIFTCNRLKKMIIPCKMDDTPMTTHPYLQQIKGISFADFNQGAGRLKMVLFNYMTRHFNLQESDPVRSLNEFMGSLETTTYLVHRENIKEEGTEEEKEFRVKKIQDTQDLAYVKLKQEEEAGREMMAFLQEQMSKLEHNLERKEVVEEVLHTMKTHPLAGRPDMKKFIAQVNAIRKSFTTHSGEPVISRYRKELKEKLASSEQQLKKNLGWLADIFFADAYENVQYFFLSSADHLEKMIHAGSREGQHPRIKECAAELLQYIQTPGGVIDNTQYGILGYADDAHFIQSLLANLQQSGILDTSDWDINWHKISAGSEFIFNIAGQHIKETLDHKIIQFAQALSAKYNLAGTQTSPGIADLQKAKDDLWKAKLMSLETSLIHNPVW